MTSWLNFLSRSQVERHKGKEKCQPSCRLGFGWSRPAFDGVASNYHEGKGGKKKVHKPHCGFGF